MLSIHCSNPRTPEGVTLEEEEDPDLRRCCFNSRTKKGGRQYYTVQDISQMKFQSTHSEECDQSDISNTGRRRVSIHAPIRVRHGGRHDSPLRPKVSIHAPQKGCDSKRTFLPSLLFVSMGTGSHKHVFSYSCRDSLKFPLLSSMFLIAKKDVHYTLALRTISRQILFLLYHYFKP